MALIKISIKIPKQPSAYYSRWSQYLGGTILISYLLAYVSEEIWFVETTDCQGEFEVVLKDNLSSQKGEL